jgi:hypothetical protein
VSPYVSTPPPVGSPTMARAVSRSISAAKFAAAENVARPTRSESLPRRSTCFDAKRARSDPYVVLSPPPFKRTSTITRRTFGFRTSRPSDPTNPAVGRSTELKPKYTAARPASLRAHIGPRAAGEVQRLRRARQDGRVVAVERIRELGRVLGPGIGVNGASTASRRGART